MTEFGISVYPDLSPMSEIVPYLNLAAKYGCTRVFSSMFSVEGSNEEILAYFRNFIAEAHKAGLKVSLDVNPGFLKQLGASYDDISLFHEIGCDILRMDISFGKEKDLVLCNNPYGIVIQMNASAGAAGELAYLKEHGVTGRQLLLGHNFYPQRYTAMKWKKFLEVNAQLAEFGYPIDAFISSQAPNTHGVWDATQGLPTVERLRDLPIDLQMRIMLATGNVDAVLIGNAYASEEEFIALQKVLQKPRPIAESPVYPILSAFGGGMMPELTYDRKLRVTLCSDITENEQKVLFDFFPHIDIGDGSEWIWRSRFPRMVQKDRPIPARAYPGDEIPAGSVVIVNDNYKHYSGEIQIARLPLKNDGTRNVIGSLSEGERMLLELIKDGDPVTFIR